MKEKRKRTILTLAVAGLLCALGVVFGKFLIIPIGDSNRISLGTLPIVLASFAYGPIVGVMAGLVSDVLGCILAGMSINPIITAASGFLGLLPGLIHRFHPKDLRGRGGVFTISVILLITHFVGDMVIKTFGLWLYYRTPLPVLALRVPIAVATAAVETVILYFLFSRRELTVRLIRCGGGLICGRRDK